MTYIRVDPADLQAVARLFDEVTADYSSLATRVSEGMPSMPPWASWSVHARVGEASWRLSTRGRELPPIRDDLNRRAAWAELVSGFSVGLGGVSSVSAKWSWRQAVDAWRALKLASSVSGFLPSLVGVASSEKGMYDLWTLQRRIGDHVVPTSLTKYLRGVAAGRRWAAPEVSKLDRSLTVLNVAVSASEIVKAVRRGDIHNVAWNAGQAGFQVATGSRYLLGKAPFLGTAGMIVGAFYTGYQLGGAINDEFHVGDNASSAILGDYVRTKYGPGDLKPQDAAALSRRYEGIGGPVHFAEDFGHATLSGLKRIL